MALFNMKDDDLERLIHLLERNCRDVFDQDLLRRLKEKKNREFELRKTLKV